MLILIVWIHKTFYDRYRIDSWYYFPVVKFILILIRRSSMFVLLIELEMIPVDLAWDKLNNFSELKSQDTTQIDYV